MSDKTQHDKTGTSSDGAREERSRKADVGEAAEQSTQSSTGVKPGTKRDEPQNPPAPAKHGNQTSGSSGQ